MLRSSSATLLGTLVLLPGCAAPGSTGTAMSSSTYRPLPQDHADPEFQAAEEQEAERGWDAGLPLDIPKRFVERPTELDVPATSADATPGEVVVAPVPFLSEQIGWGLALWAGYVFQFDEESAPSSVGAGGFYSENDSHAFLAAFTPRFGGDEWRLTLVGGAASMRYDFYGVGNEAGEDGVEVPLVSKGNFLRLEGLRAVGEDLFLGPRLTHAAVETRILDKEGEITEGIADQLDAQDLQLGLRLLHDTRDNTFFPREGRLGDLTADFAEADAGSDFGYQRYSAKVAAYHAVDETSVLAWQALAEYAGGDTPFYYLPTHRMRGYEAGRYRDRFWAGGEVEYRRELSGRLGLAAFAGLGAVAESPAEVTGSDLLPSGGLGLRIRLTEENPIDYRIDVATGGDGEAILYLSAGQAF